MTLSRRLWTAACVVLICCCRTKGRLAIVESENGLTLSIVMAENVVLLGHAAIAEIRLVNHTNANLWINSRMALERFSDLSDHRELWLQVRGPDGAEVPLECIKNIRPASSENYRVIRPGEHASHTEMLTSCFALDKPGVYTIVAFYQDGNPDPPPSPAGATYVSSLIQSAPVMFEVKSAATTRPNR